MIDVGTLSELRRMVRRDGLSVREASTRSAGYGPVNCHARVLAFPFVVIGGLAHAVLSARLANLVAQCS